MSKTLHAPFFESCRQGHVLDRCAIWHDQRQYSYAELLIRAEEIAAFLHDANIAKGDIVALMVHRGFDAVAAIYGILSIGAVYMPIDRSFPPDRIAYMHAISACEHVLTDDVARLDTLPASIVRLDLANAKEKRRHYTPATVTLEDLAYIIFTSGSTGRPKGVMIQHGSAAARMTWALERFGSDALSMVLGSTSYSFDISILELFAPLSCGGTLAIVDSPLSLADEHHRPNVTLINAAPSALSAVLAVTTLPTSVITCILVGEMLHGELTRMLYQQNIRHVFNLYGPTEDTIYSTEYRVPFDTQDNVPIGHPLPGTDVLIVDQHMQPILDDRPGELCLLGVGQARGYINRPDLTDERFVICPSAPFAGARLYRTGDRACWLASGELLCLGRLDDQVKIDGHRIELLEIIQVIRQVKGVSQATVTVVDYGTQRKGLAAYLVPANDAKPDTLLIDSVRKRIQDTLPSYMYPVSYTVLTAFPMTTSGKLDKKALPIPSASSSKQRVADAVEDALRTVTGRLDLADDIPVFAQGINSLDFMLVLAHLQQSTQRHINIHQAFLSPTLCSLRLLMEQAEPIPPTAAQHAPLSHHITQAQRQLWLAQMMTEDPTAYLLFIELKASCSPDILLDLLQAVIARHPALHTYIQLTPDGMRREPLTFDDSAVRHLVEPKDWASSVTSHFDTRAPFSASVFVHPHGACARIVADHAVFDRWSLHVLQEEIAARLDARSLPPLTAPQIATAIDEDDQAFVERAARELSDAVPLSWPLKTYLGHQAHVLRIVLPAPVATKIRQLANTLGLTVGAVGFGLFAECASQQTGVDRLAIGITLADRHPGNLHAIDCHVNTLPVLWSKHSSPTLEGRLAATGHRIFDYIAHRHVGIEPVLSSIRRHTAVHRETPFSLAFGYHNDPSTPASSTIEAAFHPNTSPRLPLTLWMEERGLQLYAIWTAHPAFFDRRDVEAWHLSLHDIVTHCST